MQQLRPQLFAAVEILQLDICQLQSYITTALLENPVLECGEAPGVSLLGDLTGTGSASGMGEEDGSALPPADFADTGAVAYGEDLTTHLLFQAGLLNLEPALQSAVRSVIHALDSDGYLRTPLEPLGPDPALLEAALRVVQRLDPAGVGARSVSECLCLQLRAEGELGLPLRIAEQYLEQAGRHAYATIAAGEHVPLAAVQEACRRIQCLSPYPCAEFSAAAAASSIVPDVLLTERNGAFSVTVNRAYTPELTVSSFYQSLWHESEDPEVRQYLAKKFTQAEWLIHCIAQREQTLLRCCQEILRLQTPYFRGRRSARTYDHAGCGTDRGAACVHGQPGTERKVHSDAAQHPSSAEPFLCAPRQRRFFCQYGAAGARRAGPRRGSAHAAVRSAAGGAGHCRLAQDRRKVPPAASYSAGRQPEALMRAALKNITCRVPPPEYTARSFVIAAA